MFVTGLPITISISLLVSSNHAALLSEVYANRTIDKYAAELGYSTELSEALVQVFNAGQPPLTVSRLYSIYHLDAPAVSERLSRLEKLRAIEEQKEGLIVLPVDEKQ